jgi:hypothetical protein
MSDPAEVFWLQQDGTLSSRYCTFMRITLDEQSNVDQSVLSAFWNKIAAVVVEIMKRWSQITSAACTDSSAYGNKVENEFVLKTRGCFVADGHNGFEWYCCSKLPRMQYEEFVGRLEKEVHKPITVSADHKSTWSSSGGGLSLCFESGDDTLWDTEVALQQAVQGGGSCGW